MQPLPLARAEPVPDRVGANAAFQGLSTAEHAELSGGEAPERIFFEC
jgi:hypothetical protein